MDPSNPENWPDGPWKHEPSRAEWRHGSSGYPCLIHRSPLGVWCGYVAVPPDHPMHGVHTGERELEGISVHGGITWASWCRGHICHVPREGEPPVWWLGFDCAHAGDLIPALLASGATSEDVYRDQVFVMIEVERVAAQLAEMPEKGRHVR